MAERRRHGRPLAALAFAVAALATAAAPAEARTLERHGLIRTFNEDFHTLNVADWRDRRTWTARNWKTWYFNGPYPDNIYNRTLPGNGENQVYTDAFWPERAPGADWPPPAHTVQTGVLRIRADRAPDSVRDRIFGLPFTSGAVSTWGMFSQRYGVFEARIKLPRGRGFWPAFWMLNASGGQPPEIDIMEFLGHDVYSIWTVAHWKERGKHKTTNRQVPFAIDMTEDFHVYAVDWRPRTITWYIDDVQVMQIPTPADMHEPMFMILNLAVGGRWGGMPDAQTVFPSYMEVDYVRAWRRPGDHPARPPSRQARGRR